MTGKRDAMTETAFSEREREREREREKEAIYLQRWAAPTNTGKG